MKNKHQTTETSCNCAKVNRGCQGLVPVSPCPDLNQMSVVKKLYPAGNMIVAVMEYYWVNERSEEESAE